MSLFTIDESRCKQDGICAAECPMGIISWQKNNFPVPAKAAQSLCINCGHCVAVCPHEALALSTLDPKDCMPVDKEKALSLDQTEYFLRSRRSIRSFKETPVEKETLARMIRMASFAPSGHNTQPVKWRVINGKERVKEHTALVIDWMKLTLKENPGLAKLLHLDMIIGAWKFNMDVVTRNAPTLILAQGEENNPMAPAAATIAMTYLDLAAQSFGVGTCWCGYFLRAAATYPPLARQLGKDQGLVTLGVMMTGYPQFKYHRIPTRNTPDITWMD